MMRLLVLISLLGAGSASASEGGVATDREADLAALREAKLVLWPGYYKNQDADGLAAFLADDFVFIQNSGARTTKQQEVDWVRDNPWRGAANDDFVYAIKDIVFQSDDVVIIYGEGTSTREDEQGNPCAHSYWSSNTLRRENDRWRPSFSHVSGAKCDPIDD